MLPFGSDPATLSEQMLFEFRVVALLALFALGFLMFGRH